MHVSYSLYSPPEFIHNDCDIKLLLLYTKRGEKKQKNNNFSLINLYLTFIAGVFIRQKIAEKKEIKIIKLSLLIFIKN